uniref:Cell cycle control protein 50A n=1 Tax=Strongyloides papillosus TaxID=174720 RepID=A0A0N5BXY6_STREA
MDNLSWYELVKQQRLSSWQPVPYVKYSVSFFIGLSVVFMVFGVVLYNDAANIHEYTADYTNCGDNSICSMTLNLTSDFKGDVYFYYGLDNFYQNYRMYIKSRSDKQLLGDVTNTHKCASYSYDENGKPIAPCGAIANSMFNDTFELSYLGNNVPLTYKGVVWESLLKNKYKNPPLIGGDLCLSFSNTSKPPNWSKEPCKLDEKNPENNGFQNVDFVVWMQTAALNNFRNLYRKLDRGSDKVFMNGLPKGLYTLKIENNFPVKDFDGKKYFIISTTSAFGGKNYFMGGAFIAVSSLSLTIALSLLIFKYYPIFIDRRAL